MAYKLLDRARMSVSGTPGTGNITLGTAITGYQSFTQAGINSGDSFAYSLVDGNYWEYGIATYNSVGNQLTRAVSKTSAQNATPLSLSSKTVISAVLRAEDVQASTTLAGLTDVNVTEGAAIDGYALRFQNSSGEWIAEPVTGSSSFTVSNNGASVDTATTGLNFVNASSVTTSGHVVTVTFPVAGVDIKNNGTDVGQATGINFVNATSITETSGVATVTLPTGGGGGSLTVKNNGTTVDSAVTTLNFANPASITDSSGAVTITFPTGGSGVAVTNNGTSVDTAATTLNFVNASSITTSSHDVTITLPTGGGGSGGPGGTPPTVVQKATIGTTSGSGTVTLGAAPTSGHLLVALVFSAANAPSAASGWTLHPVYNSHGAWYTSIVYKVAGSSESASQTPVSSGNDNWAITLYEISGQKSSGPIIGAGAQNDLVDPTSPNTYPHTTPTQAATPGTLFLAGIVANTSSDAYTTTWGVKTLDANLTSAPVAAAFGHSDSTSMGAYQLAGLPTTVQAYDYVFAIISS